MTERKQSATIKRSWMARLGSWLRAKIRGDQLADPQWDEEVQRERTGKMGEDIRVTEELQSSGR